MSELKHLLKHTEPFLIIILWVLLLSIPFIFMPSDTGYQWNDVLKPMETFIPLFILFLINRYLLVPNLLLKRQNLWYLGAVILMIGLFSLGVFLMQARIHPNDIHPPIGHLNHMPPPKIPPLGVPGSLGNSPLPFAPKQLPPYANFIVMAFLLVGFDTGLNAFFKLNQAEKERTRLEKENVSNQLNMLRHQISPHFLMNTLNNIHTLIDISAEKSKEAVMGLSKLMRYLLYDTADNITTLKNECAFIESYVELMRLRVSSKVEIVLNLPENLPQRKIQPLLFTSFIENAFKHGISYNEPSFIFIDIIPNETTLEILVKNSNHKKVNQRSSGIGFKNAKRRLDLLFGKDYQLNVVENDAIFTVHLTIPFKNQSS
jgi:hypothetical protein